MDPRAKLRGLVAQARRAARRRGQAVSTGHLLLVMLQSDSEVASLLGRQGLAEGDLLAALGRVEREPSSALDRSLERACQLAALLAEPCARPVHLLLAVARDGRSEAARCLESAGVGVRGVQQALVGLLGEAAVGALRLPEPQTTRPLPAHRRSHASSLPAPPTTARAPLRPRRPRAAPAVPARVSVPSPSVEKPSERPHSALGIIDCSADPFALDTRAFPLLTGLGRNLTTLALEGQIDPVVGRDGEQEQLLDILARRHCNNPVLVGSPGVGKTAIAEALALRMSREEVDVQGASILIELSAGALVSGTAVRGAVAERVRQLIDEVQRSEGRVLVFIDEIHAVLAGNQDNPDDLGQELKQVLGRGQLRCIGATTEREYRRHFEKDPALARRFTRVEVCEPTRADAERILAGVAYRYERHHSVRYGEGALGAAIDLSVRYVPERCLPDKALAVIDLAAARVKRRGGTIVDRAAVAGVVSHMADVPVERLLMQDGERLLRLESTLGQRVVGHERELVRIAEVLRKSAAGFVGRRPLASLLLLGPTGVGKTETAKAVSDALFPGSPVTRLDMSEFAEAHAVARLLGAPPGYVGHDDGGQLTEAVRQRPYQLILLDEIEKAHRDVLLALLPLLDEGHLTDARGRRVDFTNTIIVMTSNLGAEVEAASAPIGFSADRSQRECGDADAALAAARSALPVEFWNRIDEPLYLGPLAREEVVEIARRLLEGVAATMGAKDVRLLIEPSALHALVTAGGFDVTLGARPLRRTIGRLVEAPLAEQLLRGDLLPGDIVRVFGDGSQVFCEAVGAADHAAE